MRKRLMQAVAALLLAAASAFGAASASHAEDPGWGAAEVDVAPTPAPTATMNDPGWG
jgi:Spy/CpxP family protein refolding chaperone